MQAVTDPAAALLYFHGGGMVAGSLDTHDGLCRTLSNAAGCRVISVGYRLAPENPFPAAVEDGFAALSWIFEHSDILRINPYRIGLAGDSSGGNLAAVLCQRFSLGSGPKPVLQLLLCPVLDFGIDTESRRNLGAGYLINMKEFARELSEYLPSGTDMTDPRIAPLCARDLSRLPVTHIHTAEFDPMRDEGLAYADRLRGIDIEVHHHCHAGMIHLFYALSGVIPSAGTALRQIAAQIVPALAGAHVDDSPRRF